MQTGTVIAKKSLHLHSSPGGDETIIGTLDNGALLYITGPSVQRPKRKWLPVREFGGDREGWVDDRFVKIEAPPVPIPTSPTGPLQPVTILGIVAVVVVFLAAIFLGLFG